MRGGKRDRYESEDEQVDGDEPAAAGNMYGELDAEDFAVRARGQTVRFCEREMQS
jgi:hypothetical protein